jgi:hypothetical protein
LLGGAFSESLFEILAQIETGVAAREAFQAAEDRVAIPFVEGGSMKTEGLNISKSTPPSPRFLLRACEESSAVSPPAKTLRDPKFRDMQSSASGAAQQAPVDLARVAIAEEHMEWRVEFARMGEVEKGQAGANCVSGRSWLMGPEALNYGLVVRRNIDGLDVNLELRHRHLGAA